MWGSPRLWKKSLHLRHGNTKQDLAVFSLHKMQETKQLIEEKIILTHSHTQDFFEAWLSFLYLKAAMPEIELSVQPQDTAQAAVSQATEHWHTGGTSPALLWTILCCALTVTDNLTWL